MSSVIQSTLLASALVHDLELHLLDLCQALPLPADEVIHLFVQVLDLELGLQVDLVVVERPQAILRLLPLLAHHDDRRLQSGHARQDQIQQDEGVGIERFALTDHRVDGDPHSQRPGPFPGR